jgi:RND family efflux transporter MFP subunit
MKKTIPTKVRKIITSKWAIPSILILLVITITAIYSTGFCKKEKDQKMNLLTVRQGTIKIDLVGDGQISLPMKNLDFQIQGTIKNIWVKPGQTVKKGDKMAEIDVQTYEKDYQKAELEYEKAKAGLLNVAQQAGLNLFTNNKNNIALIGNALNSMSSYKVAKLNLDAAENSLSTAKDKLAQSVLVAPVDGKIISIAKIVGDTTGGGVSSISSNNGVLTSESNSFIAFLDSGKTYVKSNITESDINNVSLGQEVEVTVDAADGEYIPGKVVKIDGVPKVDGNNVVTYEVTAELEGDRELLREGMTSVISFIINKKDNVLIIPNQAVQSEDGRQYAEVKNQDGQIIQKSIRTGLSDGDNVEVVSGLKRGESVVVRGAQA